jgi:group I intron endonuclease
MSKDYSKGKIYKIVNNIDDEIYVGSTTQPLYKRMENHRRNCRNEKKQSRRIYSHMLEHGIHNFKIILIEEYPCKNKMELERRERHFIEVMKSKLNTNLPTRTDREYYQDNKEYIKEKSRKYHHDNREDIKIKKKQYYEANKHALLSKQHEKYLMNREQITQRRKEKVVCECGSEVRKDGLSEHRKTTKHQQMMKQN